MSSLEGPHEELSASVLHSPALNVDETGWGRAGEGRTLWTATTPEAAIFRVAEDRHRDRLEELIGADYEGIVCSDRWWAYDHLDPECRQACGPEPPSACATGPPRSFGATCRPASQT